MSTPPAVKPERRRRPPVRRKPAGRFHHPDLREALVRAAIAGVEQHGHAGLSLAHLAARVGVTQPALYRHFASKEALLAEVAARGMAELDAATAAAVLAHPDDPFAAIEAAGRTYVRFAHASPGWFRLQFSRLNVEQLQPGPPPSSASREALLAALARLVSPGDPVVFDLFRVVWGLAHGLAVFVVERVFQLVQTDEERLAAADDALRIQVDLLRARYPAR